MSSNFRRQPKTGAREKHKITVLVIDDDPGGSLETGNEMLTQKGLQGACGHVWEECA